MNTAKAYGTNSPDELLSQMTIERRELLPKDVEMQILYCGVCHTDLHMTKNHWGQAIYPMVPGHEIVGKVTAIGKEVTKFKVGDVAAVGTIVESCRHCESCKEEMEVYCTGGLVPTYGAPDKNFPGKATYGGYSERIVVDEHFTYTVPKNLDLAGVGPLLCAGVTVWGPLKHFNVTNGTKVGVIGLGGLGHMAIKLARALGADVTLFSRTPSKIVDAVELGADHVIISTDQAGMQAAAMKFDVIIDTIPYNHDVNPYVNTLNIDGVLVLVGYLGELTPSVNSGLLAMRRRLVTGSIGSGNAENQRMLDFCGKHNIVSEIELIKIQEINKAFERLEKGDVKYRFVIDMASLS